MASIENRPVNDKTAMTCSYAYLLKLLVSKGWDRDNSCAFVTLIPPKNHEKFDPKRCNESTYQNQLRKYVMDKCNYDEFKPVVWNRCGKNNKRTAAEDIVVPCSKKQCISKAENQFDNNPVIKKHLMKTPKVYNKHTFVFLDPENSGKMLSQVANYCKDVTKEINRMDESLVTMIKEYFLISVLQKPTKQNWIPFLTQLGKNKLNTCLLSGN